MISEDQVVVVRKSDGLLYLIVWCGPIANRGFKIGDKITSEDIARWVYDGIKVVQHHITR